MRWEMKFYIEECERYNIRPHIITTQPIIFENTHNVPEETIQRMRMRWEY
jgi:hypothetical protein